MRPEVGLSGLPLDYPYSGTAVYATNLLHHLPLVAPDLDFRLFVRWAEPVGSAVSSQRLTSPFAPFNRGTGVGARIDKLVWETGSLPVASALRRQSVLHSLYLAAPLVSGVPVVVTVHDLIPLLLPGYNRSAQANVYARLMAWASRRATRIITVSEFSKREIERHWRIPSSRIEVTLEAASDRFHPEADSHESARIRSRYNLPQQFALYTGGADRRKNLETLVRAWSGLRRRAGHDGTKLVIVSHLPRPDALYPDIAGLVRDLDAGHDIMLVPQVEDADWAGLYRCATLFCFPSAYEGFGLTPLEAMASGVPVVAAHATSIPEVVGNAAWLLPPDDAGAWESAIDELLRSPSQRARLREAGLERAKQFSWRKTATQTARVYRDVIG